jgi:hypothetical protein
MASNQIQSVKGKVTSRSKKGHTDQGHEPASENGFRTGSPVCPKYCGRDYRRSMDGTTASGSSSKISASSLVVNSVS